jgi:putative glutamine amidotransferase
MRKRPCILISPSQQKRGAEFSDQSLSLSRAYCEAILAAGGLPLVPPILRDAGLISEAVARVDGVMLSGGDDVETRLYPKKISPALLKKMGAVDPERDWLELVLIDEVFRQKKPLLAICRGQQILNVALGGTLIVDIPTECPNALAHGRSDRKNDVVHDVTLTKDSLLAKIVGGEILGVNSSHHQSVDRVAEPLRVTGQSKDGIIEAMELKHQHAAMLPFLLAVQFHPERLFSRHRECLNLFKVFVEFCSNSPAETRSKV